MGAPRSVRWFTKHGVARLALQRAARRGDLGARLSIDPSVYDDPFPTYDALRAQGRIVPERLMTLTADHEACQEILRSQAFRNGIDPDAAPLPLRMALTLSRDVDALGPVDPPSLLVTDPPDHTRYRKLVTGVFSARQIKKLTDRIDDVAVELLDELTGRDSIDLVGDYARLLPVTIISEILGVPLSMRDQALEWGDSAATLLDIGMDWPTFQVADKALQEFNAWGHQHFEQLRREPDGTVLSNLVQAETEGQHLTGDELMATSLLLFGAGFETTVNLIANGAVLLMRNPMQRAALREDPSLWPNAVEEILRYDSPVTSTVRIAAEDTDVVGERIAQGKVVVTLLAAANRDPKVFPEPHRFDVGRANAKEHIAFSSGVHYCLGAALAKAEGEVALRTLFARFPDIALTRAPERRATRTLRGWQKVPVSLQGRIPALAR